MKIHYHIILYHKVIKLSNDKGYF